MRKNAIPLPVPLLFYHEERLSVILEGFLSEKRNKMKEKKSKNDQKNRISEDDRLAWESAVKDAKPLKNKEKLEKTPPQSASAKLAKSAIKPTKTAPKADFYAETPGPGLDSRTDARLRKGQMPIEGRLDLHGLGQERAREALRDFIIGRQNRGARCVLVITGKGSMKGGILKQKVPEWLWEPPLRHLVLRHYPARPKDGGEGALYVLLRRNRD